MNVRKSHQHRQRYTEEFKVDAVKQVTGRSYALPEATTRLGVSAWSLHRWGEGHSQLPPSRSARALSALALITHSRRHCARVHPTNRRRRSRSLTDSKSISVIMTTGAA